MADELLVIVVADQLEIILRGPTTHKHVGVIGLEAPVGGHLDVTSSVGQATVEHRTPDGSMQPWHRRTSGPALFEETRYRLSATDLHGTEVPVIVHRDPGVFTDQDRHPGQHMVTSVLNFDRQVGFSTFTVSTSQVRITVEVEVFPTKIDYRTDFVELITEVSGRSRALALEYLRSTFLNVGTEETNTQSGLEWLTLLRNEINDLSRALHYIATRPHRLLSQNVETVPAHKIRHPSAPTRRAISRGLGTGVPFDAPPLGKIRPFLPSLQSHETLNTPEHRWIRHQLDVVTSRLGEIAVDLQREISEAKRRHHSTKRLDREASEIAQILAQVHELRNLPPLAAAVGQPPLGAPSLTLLNGLGYRQAYRSLTTLRLGLNVDGDVFDASLKALHELYETWCFLRLAALIGDILHKTPDAAEIMEATGSGLRIRLRSGIQSRIPIRDGHRTLTLSYNPRYPGLTGMQKPDIVLEFAHDGWPQIIVVFDAKYRLRSDARTIETFGSPGPPIEAVNELHRYRDAITVKVAENSGRPTVKGVALFPLSSDGSANYTTSGLYKSLQELGVGALPFLPSNTSLVQQWLTELLAQPLGELLQPGPPFLAWEQARGPVVP